MVFLRDWQFLSGQYSQSMAATTETQPPAAHPAASASATATSVSSAAGPQAVAGIPAGGSSLTAGSDTAVLQLSRGGELRVCPGTTVAVSPGQNGSMTLGLNLGAMEVHYPLTGSSDVVLTPDFRFQLTGPAEFDFAFSTDRKGNTCARALGGNTGFIAVSELMGDGTYIVRPREQIVFRNGSLANVAFNVPPDCGCPAAVATTLMAGNSGPPQGGIQLLGDPARTPPGPGVPALAPGQGAVAVDAPLVFRGERPNPNSAISPEVAALSLIARSAPSGWELIALPTPELAAAATKGKEAAGKAGILQRVKHFFSTLFR